MASKGRGETRTGGRAATTGVILGDHALSVGMPSSPLPDGWGWVRLTDVARLETGHTPSRKHPEYWGGDVPWIGIRDATANHGGTLYRTNQYTNDIGIENSSARVLPANTVCLSRTASIGYVVVMGRPMATSQDFVNWVCSRSLDFRYLKYVLLAERESFLRFASGTTHQTIYFPEVKAFHAALPSINEQKRIADVLSALDDRIDNLRQTNTTLEAIAQALFKTWFVDFDPVRAKAEGREPEGMDAATAALFPSEFEDSELGQIPKGWCVSTIGERVSVVDCLHAKKPEMQSEGRPYLQLNCIRGDGLLDAAAAARISQVDYEKWTSRIEATPGDCVITNVGRVGAVAQIPTGFKAAIGRNMTGLRPREIPPTFLIELLMSDYMRREIEQKTDAGTILNALNVKSIPKLRFVCASEDAMSRFEDIGRPLRSAMETNLQRAGSLAELRDTLLPRLISGKLRLPDVAREAEAALV